MKAFSFLHAAKSLRAAEALLDVVTGKLKAAEKSLKADEEVQLLQLLDVASMLWRSLGIFGVFESTESLKFHMSHIVSWMRFA